MKTNPTAKAAYKSEQKRATKQLKDIAAFLEIHAKRQSVNVQDWGFPGDLQRVNELLAQVQSAIR